ncbi:(4Fe-4S)-binding protein, partial [Alistipes ihumii]
QVYRPRLRPWVDPTRATTRQLIEQIERCPSGALSYRLGCGSSGR